MLFMQSSSLFFFLGCPITELITWDTEKVINGTNEKSGIEYVSL